MSILSMTSFYRNSTVDPDVICLQERTNQILKRVAVYVNDGNSVAGSYSARLKVATVGVPAVLFDALKNQAKEKDLDVQIEVSGSAISSFDFSPQ
jgi:hypothetical protein